MAAITKNLLGVLACAAGGLAASAYGQLPVMAAEPGALTVHVDRIKADGGHIPPRYAFCVAAKEGHSKSGANRNPTIRWSKGPAATMSYAIIVHDPDVPSKFDDANKEGKTIAADLPRIDFVHMVLVDIPATFTEIKEGQDSDKVTPKGKPPGKTDHGVRGVNDYGKFMSGDMAGSYGGYDGPCPPWNDSIWHHYHFDVYALDVASLNLSGNITADQATAAMKGHVVATGSFIGTFSQNPDLFRKRK